MKKRILSLLLALALVLTGVPMAFATESGFADGQRPGDLHGRPGAAPEQQYR